MAAVTTIVRSLTRQLSWTHYYYLIDINENEKRTFYENKVIINSWSVRELRRQIRNRLYENTPKKEIQAVFHTKLPAVRPQEIFKDTYNFQFIELKGQNEKELEEKILVNLITFLGELGEDFCIRGSQIPLKIDQETHHIDLVLYHYGIPCSVLVDLKIGRLSAQDIGQINKYLGYWRRHKQYAHEQPAIGLIICREAGQEEVVYALDGLEEKIFIAKYKIKLPSEAKIKKALKNL
jgi:predicted nuclease of restriction endonuclease-like (RecB) superfamily